jgi:hypothetical protein
VPGWALAQGAGLTDPAAVAERFAFLAAERLAGLLAAPRPRPASSCCSSDLPVFSDILGRAIDQLFHVENLEDRFAVCLFFLKDDTLGYRQNEVMVDLLGVVKQMMQPDRHMDVDTILSRLTAFFRDRDNQFLLMRFQCYEAIGVAIGEAGNVKAADHLIEDILSWRFQYPEIRGATDEWETVVNPYHLPKIRCWMHIIESNPALYERLAAALNVQLRLGGVYIADTDLFQRDVTRFLNADIRPIYFVAKQLLRTLPVYFNEVGAEGELRSVSTEIDEICGRRDTLMHFLRKQVARRVVEPPGGLQPRRAALLGDARPAGWSPTCRPTPGGGARRAGVGAGPHETLLALQKQLAASRSRRRAPRSRRPAKSFLDRRSGADAGRARGRARDSWRQSRGSRRGDGEATAAGATHRRRVALMVRTYQLLAHKYSLSADDVGAASAAPAARREGAPAVRARAGTPGRREPAGARDRCSTPRSPCSRS